MRWLWLFTDEWLNDDSIGECTVAKRIAKIANFRRVYKDIPVNSCLSLGDNSTGAHFTYNSVSQSLRCWKYIQWYIHCQSLQRKLVFRNQCGTTMPTFHVIISVFGVYSSVNACISVRIVACECCYRVKLSHISISNDNWWLVYRLWFFHSRSDVIDTLSHIWFFGVYNKTPSVHQNGCIPSGIVSHKWEKGVEEMSALSTRTQPVHSSIIQVVWLLLNVFEETTHTLFCLFSDTICFSQIHAQSSHKMTAKASNVNRHLYEKARELTMWIAGLMVTMMTSTPNSSSYPKCCLYQQFLKQHKQQQYCAHNLL